MTSPPSPRRSLSLALRSAAGTLAKASYAAVPVSMDAKLAAKEWLFLRFPAVFRNTNAYRRWNAYRHGMAAMSLPPMPGPLPVAIPAAAAPAAAPASAPVVDIPPWRADGRREWADYAPLRDRIRTHEAARRQAIATTPREMIDFAGKDPVEVAKRIRLPAPPERPEVTLLVPAYGNLALTLECLASIAATAARMRTRFEVLVADDASPDDTARVLPLVQHLRIVAQPRNLGFLRNCNAAAAEARGRYLVFLNNDVQVTGDWLDRMIALFADPAVGAVGPRIVFPGGHLQEAGARFAPDGTARMIGLNDDPSLPRFAYDREVDYCSGACLMVARADFEALGGFDERYAPAYCEDSDLCLRLREQGRKVMYCASAEVVHHLSRTSDALPSDYKLACIARNLETFFGRWQDWLERNTRVRTIAFYLPQFHPIPENDLWWGRGFTEWTNVTRARPNFVGHDQPRVPADLGYYDLRVPAVMRQQADLAKRYGLGAFCFYYYWFAGRRLLEHPIEQYMADPDIDFPFCLCWANENWSRRWDGQDQDVLMAQAHSPEDDIAVVHDLIRHFRRPNYLRVDGRPLMLIYRASQFPDFAATAARWREACREAGVGEIYLAHVESFDMIDKGIEPARFGCDAAVEFPPHGMAETYDAPTPLLNPDFTGRVADFRDIATRYAVRRAPPYKRFMGIMPGWDNTARRQDHSYVFEHSSPGAFRAWMEHAVERTRDEHTGEERLLFINAWNEWAEGAYLEPDRRFGHGFLEAHRDALDAASLLRRSSYALGG